MKKLVNHLIGVFCMVVISSINILAQVKRLPYKLSIIVDKSTVYEEDVKATPYVLPNNTIQLYPGENIYVEVESTGGVITSLNAIKENKNPSKTLVISFSQTISNKTHKSMLLRITNPFKEKLYYSAVIFLMQQKKWVNTDVYPVEAEISSFESWPDIITSIALSKCSFKSE
jgi:hypothetical protein